ncbi:MAG TPA: ACT domain-containing protein [Armatimonadota bacterium]|jgi:glycine cleavage system transcriptional repressor
MAKHLVLTAIGRDRPGLVAGVTDALLSSGCNVEDSSMTRLRGEFAMILLVRHPDAPVEPLRRRLDTVRDGLKLVINLRELKSAEVNPPEQEGDSYHISVYGADTVGIVHAIAETLADRNADITDLRTALAGTQDQPVYIMQIEALAAPDEDFEGLRSALSEAGRQLGVDVSVQRLDAVTL